MARTGVTGMATHWRDDVNIIEWLTGLDGKQPVAHEDERPPVDVEPPADPRKAA